MNAAAFFLGALARDPSVDPDFARAFAQFAPTDPEAYVDRRVVNDRRVHDFLVEVDRRQASRRFSDVVEVSTGYIHPIDDSLEWVAQTLTRKQAAADLRWARRQGLRVEKSTTGYEISPVVNPHWSAA